jgi:hypothetical protein
MADNEKETDKKEEGAPEEEGKETEAKVAAEEEPAETKESLLFKIERLEGYIKKTQSRLNTHQRSLEKLRKQYEEEQKKMKKMLKDSQGSYVA